jgi:hypothetical protein
MVANMKTTVEISDAVFAAAKETAHREETTLRALIEEGLRLCIEQRQQKRDTEPFRLRDASVGGSGLQPALRDASWEQIRALIYEDPDL